MASFHAGIAYDLADHEDAHPSRVMTNPHELFVDRSLKRLPALKAYSKMQGSISQIVFVMTGACGSAGGVAAVNIQILRALSSLVNLGTIELTVLSYGETQASRPLFLPAAAEYRSFGGNKAALATAMLARVPSRPVFLFDYLRLSQPILPFTAIGLLRTIIFAHGRDYWERAGFIDRLTLRTAALVLTNSNFTLKKIQAAVGNVNAVACPLGLPEQVALSEVLLTKPPEPLALTACDGIVRPLGDRVLLLVGRMHSGERGKGHDVMLRVLPELLSRFPTVQLVFAGPGDDRDRLTAIAQNTRVANAVFIPGAVSAQTLLAIYSQCYAFTMPSRQEGFGLVYLEAMNFSKPCLGCRDDGAEDVIIHGETGWLVGPSRSQDELVEALSSLLSNTQMASDMGRRGFERLRSYFTAEHFRARLLVQFAQFLDKRWYPAHSLSSPRESESRWGSDDTPVGPACFRNPPLIQCQRIQSGGGGGRS